MMVGGILGDLNHYATIPERAFDWAAVDLRRSFLLAAGGAATAAGKKVL
jgi:hypothetical protein